ncbi:hypothetical protein BpHYR1_047665 [Brachionus plicatilis]|uniref:Uncharacterized protein n=1 Tax=Brachionus plicatilis TaxID=10195 RepID=A0A3M7S1K4_BRAPC|nr:hypothetical protein BpHYR1_047665 [Brachionus plicatilis]
MGNYESYVTKPNFSKNYNILTKQKKKTPITKIKFIQIFTIMLNFIYLFISLNALKTMKFLLANLVAPLKDTHPEIMLENIVESCYNDAD